MKMIKIRGWRSWWSIYTYEATGKALLQFTPRLFRRRYAWYIYPESGFEALDERVLIFWDGDLRTWCTKSSTKSTVVKFVFQTVSGL